MSEESSEQMEAAGERALEERHTERVRLFKERLSTADGLVRVVAPDAIQERQMKLLVQAMLDLSLPDLVECLRDFKSE